MMRKSSVWLGLTSSLILLGACANPEKVIPGTWTVVEAKFDGQNELSISDSNQNPDCGNETASATAQITSAIFQFNEDGTYTNTTTLSVTYTYNSDQCLSISLPITETDTISGTWTLLGKDKLLLKTSSQEAECTIVKLKRKKMILSCPCMKDCQFDLLEDGDIDYTLKETEFSMEKQ